MSFSSLPGGGGSEAGVEGQGLVTGSDSWVGWLGWVAGGEAGRQAWAGRVAWGRLGSSPLSPHPHQRSNL